MIVCHFCNASVRDTEEAIQQDWIPSFWDDADDCEEPSPVCPHCCRQWLTYDETAGHVLPARWPVPGGDGFRGQK